MNTETFEKRLTEMEQKLSKLEEEQKEVIEADKKQYDELQEKYQAAVEQNRGSARKIVLLEKERDDYAEELNETQKQLRLMELQVKASHGLTEFVDERIKMIYSSEGRSPHANDAGSAVSVEKTLRALLGLEEGAEITLEHVKKVIKVKKVMRHLPTIDTTMPKGKILDLVARGKMERHRTISDIEKDVPGLARIQVVDACKDLAKDDVLLRGKMSDGKLTYMRHPDVQVLQEIGA